MNNPLTGLQDLYLLPLVPHPTDPSHKAVHIQLPRHEQEQTLMPLVGRPPLLLVQQAFAADECKPSPVQRKQLKACQSYEGFEYILRHLIVHIPSRNVLTVGSTPCPDWMVDVVPGVADGQLFVARSIRDFRLLTLPLSQSKTTTEEGEKNYPQPARIGFSTCVLLDPTPGTQQVYLAPDPKNTDFSNSVELWDLRTNTRKKSVVLADARHNQAYVCCLGRTSCRLLALLRLEVDAAGRATRLQVSMLDRKLTTVLQTVEFEGDFVLFPRHTNFKTKFRYKRQTFYLVSLAQQRQPHQQLCLSLLLVAVCDDQLITKFIPTEVPWQREYSLLGCVLEPNTKKLRVFIDLSNELNPSEFGIINFRLAANI